MSVFRKICKSWRSGNKEFHASLGAPDLEVLGILQPQIEANAKKYAEIIRENIEMTNQCEHNWKVAMVHRKGDEIGHYKYGNDTLVLFCTKCAETLRKIAK